MWSKKSWGRHVGFGIGLFLLGLVASTPTTAHAQARAPETPQATPINGGTSYGTAVEIVPDVDYSAVVDAGQTKDFFVLTVAPGQVLTIYATTGTTWYGGWLSLFDQFHASDLFYNYIVGEERSVPLVYMGNTSTPTKYFFVIQSNGYVNEYTFRATTANQNDGGQSGDAGDSAPELARPISPTFSASVTFSGTTGGADRFDYYRLTTLPGQVFTITFTPLDWGNQSWTYVSLYKESQANGGDDLQSRTFNPPSKVPQVMHYTSDGNDATTYYLRVNTEYRYAGLPLQYRVDIQFEPQSDGNQAGDAGSTPATAHVLTPTTGSLGQGALLSFTGATGADDQYDYYRFNLPLGYMITITVTPLDWGAQSRTYVYLQDVSQAGGSGYLSYRRFDSPSKLPQSMYFMGNSTESGVFYVFINNDVRKYGPSFRYKIDLEMRQQSDGNQTGDAGDTFNAARIIGSQLDASDNYIGSNDEADFYLIDLPIAPGSETPYKLMLDSVLWPPGSNAVIYITRYKPNRAQSGNTESIGAPVTDGAEVDLTNCDLCYIRISVNNNNNTPQLRYSFHLVGEGIGPTPTGTPIPTATPAPIVTVTPPPVTTTPPPSLEPNDGCETARNITSDGVAQLHYFETLTDTDWVKFVATKNTRYVVEASVPSQSVSDIEMELYVDCNSLSTRRQNFSYAAGVRMEYDAEITGTIYLRFFNPDADKSGLNTQYYASVRDLNTGVGPGAVIVVAGRDKPDDHLQDDIDATAKRVYTLFKDQHYTDERITFLTTNTDSVGKDGAPGVDTLRLAITTWAKQWVSGGRAFTLYIVDHGQPGRVYLNKDEWVTPAQLDSWLAELEAAVPDVKINVIIEACYAGSFIQPPSNALLAPSPSGISRPGRVVIASTTPADKAYVSTTDIIFSNHFLTALANGSSLFTSFNQGHGAASQAHPDQIAWLDADGDGTPNEPGDEEIAAQRGFQFAGTLASESWPPFIKSVAAPRNVANGRARIQAVIRDDVSVNFAWVMIYPPGYTSSEQGSDLVRDLGAPGVGSAVLADLGGGNYGIEYAGFTQSGTYRIVVYASDKDGLEAVPFSFEITASASRVFLPIVMRELQESP